MMRNRLLIGLLLVSAFLGGTVSPGLGKQPLPPLGEAPNDLKALVDERSSDLSEGLRLNLLAEMGIIQARVGQREAARATFQKIFTQLSATIPQQPDPYSYRVSNGIEALLKLALAQGEAEDPEGQAATLDYIRSLSSVMTDSFWIKGRLSPPLRLRLKHMPLHQVRPILLAIPDIAYGAEGERADQNTIIATQNFLAEAYAALGQKEAALASLRKIPDFTLPKANGPEPLPISSELLLLARLGELPMLQRYLNQDFGKLSKLAPLRQAMVWDEMIRLASALIDGGNIVEGTRVFERILLFFRTSPPLEEGASMLKVLVWQQIAIVYAKLGDIDGVHQAEAQAQAAFAHLSSTEIPGGSWRYLAEFQLQAGDIQGARQTASQALDVTLAYIIIAQAEHGDVVGAQMSLATFDQEWASSESVQARWAAYKTIEHPFYYHAAVRAVAKARVVDGDIWATLEWARKYPYPDLKAYALVGFVEGLLAQQNQAE